MVVVVGFLHPIHQCPENCEGANTNPVIVTEHHHQTTNGHDIEV